MLGRDAARHATWTLMERARTMLVIQRERPYPSRSAEPWKLESPKLLRPLHALTPPRSHLYPTFSRYVVAECQNVV